MKTEKIIKEKRVEIIGNRIALIGMVIAALNVGGLLLWVILKEPSITTDIPIIILGMEVIIVFIGILIVGFQETISKRLHPSDEKLKKWGTKILPKIKKEFEERQKLFEEKKEMFEEIEKFLK